MSQHILVAKTTEGVQIAFTEPVLTAGVKAGSRLSLSDSDVELLASRLQQYLAGQDTLAKGDGL